MNSLGVTVLGIFVLHQKMLYVAGDQKVCVAGISTFVETVIRFVAGYGKGSSRLHEEAGFANECEHLADPCRGNLKARAPQHLFVFSQDIRGDKHEDSLVCSQIKN